MRKASDDRDRVFALLGLVNLQGRLVPDYRQSPAKVFMSVCWASIQETGTLDALCGGLGHKNRGDLPSWTPDWSAITHESQEWWLKLLVNYKACSDHKAVLGPKSWNDQVWPYQLHPDPFTLQDRPNLPPWARVLVDVLDAWRLHTTPSLRINHENLWDEKYLPRFSYLDNLTGQNINIEYDHPKGGRLCGLGTLVGIVECVREEPVYESTDLRAIVRAVEHILYAQYGLRGRDFGR